MTIIYQNKVATTTFFGFFRLLKTWRGSVYKLIYKEILIYCLLYFIISLIYRFWLPESSQRIFEQVVAYCNKHSYQIPVSFILGFYVTLVVSRWWTQFVNYPWPDRALYVMGSYVVGRDEASRIIRRTVARYMMASLVLILRTCSVSVMKRYPSMDHIVNAGFLTQGEVVDIENVNCKYHKFWVPLVWANTVITNARREGRITSEYGFRFIIEQLADFRDRCSICFVFDWITIPLVYTQVVTLAVYIYFGASLIGRQYVENTKGDIDLYIPVFTLLQFLFYMGWLKVAEQGINPFGEDDDDFDMNFLLDRHWGAAWCLVDYCHQVVPDLVKDMHFNEIATEDPPYTEASMASHRPNFMGSAYTVERPSLLQQRLVLNPDLYEKNHGNFAGLRRISHAFLDTALKGSKDSLLKADSLTALNGHPGHGPLDISMTSLNRVGGIERRASIDSRISDTSFRSAREESFSAGQLTENNPARRDVVHKNLKRIIDGEKERKWSFPLNLFHRRGSKSTIEDTVGSTDVSNDGDVKTPLISPSVLNKEGRHHAEMVPADHDVDASKQARNKHILDKHMIHLTASRPPCLSAIEEGSKEILIPSTVPSMTSINEEVTHNGTHNGDSEIPRIIIEGDEDHDDDSASSDSVAIKIDTDQ